MAVCGPASVVAQSPAADAVEPGPETGRRIIRDVVYASRAAGGDLTLDLYLPTPTATPSPLVVWLHGGGWTHGNKADAVRPRYLVDAGYTVASVQYRFSQTATFPAQYDDCLDAVRFLKQAAGTYGLKAETYVVVGESAGGQLAALLGTRAPADLKPAAVIELFGPMDLVAHVRQTRRPGRQASQSVQKLVGGDPTISDDARRLAEAASPLRHVSSDDPPFLLVHGTADPLVHPDQVTEFADSLTKAGIACEVEWVDRAGHAGDAFWTPTLQARYTAFLHAKRPLR